MRTCKACRTRYEATRPMQQACSVPCALLIGQKRQEKTRAKAAKEDRAKDRIKLKRRGDYLKEAKVAIQQARRLEELAKGRGCMSCLRTREEVESSEGWKPGGAWDGSHFISKGSRPELALEPLNIWLNCKSCNAGAGKYARKGYTVMQSFEANLRAIEGDALVDWLKGPHEAKHWTIEDLQAIKTKYSALARELKKKAET